MKPLHSQRGAATIGVTLLLLFVMTLVVGIANRNLIFEQRSSANQLRSTRAFEAAEAGLEWALAMLNSDTPIGADCTASSTPGEPSFRQRFLDVDATSRKFIPRSWSDAGTAIALQAACVVTDGGWSCSCPSSGYPTLAASVIDGSRAAFALRFAPAERSGMVQLVATGCDGPAAACLPGPAGPSTRSASAQTQLTLGLLPTLASVPAAALTVRGDIAAAGALGLVNVDATSGGITAQAGGSIALPNASLVTLPDLPAAGSVAAHDGGLAALEPQRVASHFLGLDLERLQRLPGVHSLTCPADCTPLIARALGPDVLRPLLWIANDLQIDGPLTLGSPERPVLLVVEGQIRLSGGVQVHGLILSLAANWDTSGTHDAVVRGALIAGGSVIGDGTPTIIRDAGILQRLHGEFGTFTRVPGSWRDF